MRDVPLATQYEPFSGKYKRESEVTDYLLWVVTDPEPATQDMRMSRKQRAREVLDRATNEPAARALARRILAEDN